MKILSIGLGDIGKAVANRLAEQGHVVTGISRSPKQDLHADIRHLQVDVSQPEFWLENAALNDASFDHVIVILAPRRGSGEQGYIDAYLETAKQICAYAEKTLAHNVHQKLPSISFISSTSVYGENSGGWCDESTPENPQRYNGKILLEAEQTYRVTFGDKLTVIRPSGIYGIERLRLIKMIDGGKVVSPTHWSNRIFDADLVNIICQAVHLLPDKRQPLYLATDTQPTLLVDVLDGIAQQLDKSPVPRLEQSEVTGKRLRSLYLPDEWLTYPTWQAGYATVLQHISG